MYAFAVYALSAGFCRFIDIVLAVQTFLKKQIRILVDKNGHNHSGRRIGTRMDITIIVEALIALYTMFPLDWNGNLHYCRSIKNCVYVSGWSVFPLNANVHSSRHSD